MDKKGHENNGKAVLQFFALLLWSEAHTEAGQVTVSEGEEDHEDNEPGIMVEEDGQVVAGLNITQHEERDEDQASTDEER